jgi:hypothetical protein
VKRKKPQVVLKNVVITDYAAEAHEWRSIKDFKGMA